MTTSRTISEMFIKTLSDMLRDERDGRAARLSNQIRTQSNRFLRGQRKEAEESAIPVARFPNLRQGDRSYGA